ncbi:unnamed protein product, partial [Pylaiella littoralis]
AGVSAPSSYAREPPPSATPPRPLKPFSGLTDPRARPGGAQAPRVLPPPPWFPSFSASQRTPDKVSSSSRWPMGGSEAAGSRHKRAVARPRVNGTGSGGAGITNRDNAGGGSGGALNVGPDDGFGKAANRRGRAPAAKTTSDGTRGLVAGRGRGPREEVARKPINHGSFGAGGSGKEPVRRRHSTAVAAFLETAATSGPPASGGNGGRGGRGGARAPDGSTHIGKKYGSHKYDGRQVDTCVLLPKGAMSAMPRVARTTGLEDDRGTRSASVVSDESKRGRSRILSSSSGSDDAAAGPSSLTILDGRRSTNGSRTPATAYKGTEDGSVGDGSVPSYFSRYTLEEEQEQSNGRSRPQAAIGVRDAGSGVSACIYRD